MHKQKAFNSEFNFGVGSGTINFGIDSGFEVDSGFEIDSGFGIDSGFEVDSGFGVESDLLLRLEKELIIPKNGDRKLADNGCG